MNTIIRDEINDSIESILRLLGPYVNEESRQEQIDDLEILISWMDPIEQHHNFKPPTLRVKTIINNIINGGNKNSSTTTPKLGFSTTSTNTRTYGDINQQNIYATDWGKYASIEQFLFSIYFTRVRQHFFKNFNKITSLKMALRLEELYIFPQQYCFTEYKNMFENEIIILRKYLLNKNLEFEKTVIDTLSKFNKEHDFLQVQKIYKWMSRATESRFIIVDLMISLLKSLCFELCNDHLSWYQENTVDVVFKKFYEKYWLPHYEPLLNINNVEERYDFLKEIRLIIISEFVRIRSGQSFQVCVQEFPKSLPTLNELKPILASHSELSYMFVTKLSIKIATELLKPSILTAKILYSYLIVFKVLTFLNENSKNMKQVVLGQMVGTLRERIDISKTVLCGLFDLSDKEFLLVNGPSIKYDSELLHRINLELMNDMNIKVENQINEFDVYSRKYIGSVMTWFEREQFKWQPEPWQNTIISSTNYQSFIEAVSKNGGYDQYPTHQRDGFDAVLYIIFNNDRDKLLTDVIEILKKLILGTKYYELDSKWIKIIEYLKNKFKNKTSSDDNSLLTHLDIMLYDIENSKKFYNFELSANNILVPKITSYLYWEMLNDYKKIGQLEIPIGLKNQFNVMNKKYAKFFENGKKLKLYETQGIVEIKLTFDDGRVFEKDVSMYNAILINCFQENVSDNNTTLSSEELISYTKIDKKMVLNSLSYWIHEKIVYCCDQKYGIIEDLSKIDELTKGGDSLQAHEANFGIGGIKTDTELLELIELLEPIKPFILGMLTNLGTLKLPKIFSFLSMTVPKEIGFKCTQTQLKTYLNHLVQNKTITMTSGGAYKLPKKGAKSK